MKTVNYKIALIFAVVCSISALTSKYFLKVYNMAIETGQNKTAGNATGAAGNETKKIAQLANSTNVVGALGTDDVRVAKAPFEIKKCDQVIMMSALRIENYDNYTTRAPAFFTMSAYLINVFATNDTNKLIESINLGHIKNHPAIIQGSKNCLGFQDDVNKRNISMCIEDPKQIEIMKKSYSDLMRCRMGGDLKEFDPVTINNVLKASCNGFNFTVGVEFDLPKIKAKMAEELKKAGFEVSENSTTGSSQFGMKNHTVPKAKATISRPARKVDMRVPGTY